jgi:hypothetical protein
MEEGRASSMQSNWHSPNAQIAGEVLLLHATSLKLSGLPSRAWRATELSSQALPAFRKCVTASKKAIQRIARKRGRLKLIVRASGGQAGPPYTPAVPLVDGLTHAVLPALAPPQPPLTLQLLLRKGTVDCSAKYDEQRLHSTWLHYKEKP